MSFTTLLLEIVEGCHGGVGAALMGYDGVSIAQVTVGTPPEGPLADDVSTAGVEFARPLEEIRKASDALAGGAVREAIVLLSRFSLVFSSVDEDTFLVLVLAPNANLGRARYLIRRHMPALRREL